MSRRHSPRATEGKLAQVCTCCEDNPTRDGAFVCSTCLDRLGSELLDLQPSVVRSGGPASVVRVAVVERDASSPWPVCPWPARVDVARVRWSPTDQHVPGLWADLTAAIIPAERGIDYRSLGGATGGSDEVGLVINETAVAVADWTRDALRALVRLCMAAHVTHEAPAGWQPRARAEVLAMTEWLSWRVAGLAWTPDAGPLVANLHRAIESARWVVLPPPARQQLGACPVPGCNGLLSADRGDTFARCSRCRGAVEAEPLRTKALADLADRLCTAAEIAELSTYLGLRGDRDVVRRQINTWHHRGRITPAGATSANGAPRFRFGDVYDLLVERDERLSNTTRKGA